MLALLLSVECRLLAAQSSPSVSVPARNELEPTAEKNFDLPGPQTLAPGERFKITVPVRISIAVNLGAAQLDIAVARKAKGKKDEEDLHLIAGIGGVQASLKPGDRGVVLHGVVPSFMQDRVGDYHPTDYNIHFGSGNIKNIGTPDEDFIDTEALTKKMQSLRLRLVAGTRK